MVKLTRTLAIIPTVLVFAAISMHLKKKAAGAGTVQVRMRSVFPWFILGFLALSGLRSLGLIPAEVAGVFKTVSKFLMVCALAAIGLNTSFAKLCKSGAKPSAARIHHFAAGGVGGHCGGIRPGHCTGRRDWIKVLRRRRKCFLRSNFYA